MLARLSKVEQLNLIEIKIESFEFIWLEWRKTEEELKVQSTIFTSKIQSNHSSVSLLIDFFIRAQTDPETK